MARHEVTPDISAHTPGTPRGEERVRRDGREPGRRDPRFGRTARDATSINPKAREPIDPQMPEMPPP
jgi:hypothetical protein